MLCARPVVGDAPFMVHLADDLIDAKVPCLKQMAEAHAIHGGSMLGVQNVPRQDTDKYGIVTLERNIAPRVGKMSHIVEKPKPDKAQSTLAVVGRYLLSASLFDDLAKIGKGAGGEIQLTDGIAALMNEEAVYAHRFTGKRYDCGSKLGYLQATVEYGLAHPALGKEFRKYLQHLNVDKVASKDDTEVKEAAHPAGSGGGRGKSGNGAHPAAKRGGGRRKSGRVPTSA